MTRRLLALVVAAFAAVLLGALPAAAHTELASSDPADGAQLDAVPDTITLTFGEDLQGPTAKVGVLIGDNNPIQVDAPVSGPTVTIDTKSGPLADVIAKSSAGKWAIGYQVVGQDGHPIDGTLTFTVAESTSSESSAEVTASNSDSASPSPAADAKNSEDDGPEQVAPWLWALILAGSAAAVFAVVKIDRTMRRRKKDRTQA